MNCLQESNKIHRMVVVWGKEPWLGVIWGTSEDPSSLYFTFTWRPLWALLFLYYCAARENEA